MTFADLIWTALICLVYFFNWNISNVANWGNKNTDSLMPICWAVLLLSSTVSWIEANCANRQTKRDSILLLTFIHRFLLLFYCDLIRQLYGCSHYQLKDISIKSALFLSPLLETTLRHAVLLYLPLPQGFYKLNPNFSHFLQTLLGGKTFLANYLLIFYWLPFISEVAFIEIP